MDQSKDRVLLISGNNIFEESDIYLRNGATILYPIKKIVTNNSTVRLTFDDDKLIPGNYNIYIKNPGGLDVFRGGFFVGYNKKFEAFLKIGYISAIPLTGDSSNTFGSNIYPGITFNVELLASQRSSFKAGMGLTASIFSMDGAYSDGAYSSGQYNNYSSNATMTDYSLNISFQSRYNHLKNAVSFSLGFGITDYSYNDIASLHGSLEISGLFLIYKDFYFDIGVEATYYLSGSLFFLKPKISLVLKI